MENTRCRILDESKRLFGKSQGASGGRGTSAVVVGGDLEQVKGKCNQKYIICMHHDVIIKPGDFVINK